MIIDKYTRRILPPCPSMGCGVLEDILRWPSRQKTLATVRTRNISGIKIVWDQNFFGSTYTKTNRKFNFQILAYELGINWTL